MAGQNGLDGGLLGAIIYRIQENQRQKAEREKIAAEARQKAQADHERTVQTYKQNYMKDAIRNAMKAQVANANEDADVNYIKNGGDYVPQERTVYQAYGMPDPVHRQQVSALQTGQKILADDDEYKGLYGSGGMQ